MARRINSRGLRRLNISVRLIQEFEKPGCAQTRTIPAEPTARIKTQQDLAMTWIGE